MMSNFLQPLTSRKFLLALGATITFIALGQFDQAMLTVLGYIGVEGAGDFVERKNNTAVEQ